MDEKDLRRDGPHPEAKPKYPGAVDSKALSSIFAGCGDYETRTVLPGLFMGADGVVLCWLDGLVDGITVSEDVLRPLTDIKRTIGAQSPAQLELIMEQGAAYSYTMRRRKTLDDVVSDLVNGYCAVCFDSLGEALSFDTRTKLTRSVSEPTVEKAIKGGKDAFVETIRTNTSLVRRKVRTPKLKIKQSVVGRLSGTSVALLYIEGVAQQGTVDEAFLT